MLDTVPRIDIGFHEEKQSDALEKLWMTDRHPTMRFGVIVLKDGHAPAPGANVRRLTFDPWGRTNNTCLREGGKDERLFGGSGGSWDERAVKQWKDDQGKEHDGVRSVWVCDDKKVQVTQFVELRPRRTEPAARHLPRPLPDRQPRRPGSTPSASASCSTRSSAATTACRSPSPATATCATR